MNERLKELRKALGLTQQDFADRIKVKRNTVATYEMGRTGLSDAVVSLICREFDVNANWLRTGEGDMFLSLSFEDEFAKFTKDLLKDESNVRMREIISGIRQLPEPQLDFIAITVKALVEEYAAKNAKKEE